MIAVYKEGNRFCVWTEPEGGEYNGRCLSAAPTLEVALNEALVELERDVKDIKEQLATV